MFPFVFARAGRAWQCPARGRARDWSVSRLLLRLRARPSSHADQAIAQHSMLKSNFRLLYSALLYIFFSLSGQCSLADTPLSGLTWPSSPITWAFAQPGVIPHNLGTVTSAITDPAQQAEVIAGIEEWAKVSGVQLVQVMDPSVADIQIGYGDPTNLIGEDSWYYNPSNSTFIADWVLLKDPAISSLSLDSSGHLAYSNGVELRQVTTHEFGVGLGLAEGDGSDVYSVLNHVLSSLNRVPDSADIAAIDKLYGPAPAPSPFPYPH
jgi:hypothetical protein